MQDTVGEALSSLEKLLDLLLRLERTGLIGEVLLASGAARTAVAHARDAAALGASPLHAVRERAAPLEPSRIPFDELALDATEVGQLFGQTKRYVLERLSVRPGFPRPCTLPGMQRRWRAGDVLTWRDANTAPRPMRTR